MQRKKAVVIGIFVDAEHQVWSPQAKAFDTIKDALKYLDSRARLENEDGFMSHQNNFVDEITLGSEDDEIDALIEVVRGNPNVAIKTFRTRHDANSFVSLIKQMAAKRAKMMSRRVAIAS